MSIINKPLLGLMFRYGMVGLLASAVHFGIGVFLHEKLDLIPFVAHIFGFFGGLFTAYTGHYYYSFKDAQKHSKRFPKFVITALVSLTLHQSGVYIMVNRFQLDYSFQALPILLVSVPLVSFLMSKFWVFADQEN
ncbi:MAG: GtrA family protein [Proteobacteria bacterium]|nr:GtrA family protein [Pseudomonadota bacterium]